MEHSGGTPRDKGRKRFQRNENPQPMRMTARVISFLGYLARFRFLTSHQFQRLDGGSEQQVLRLLHRMYDHNLIERPRAQIAKLAHFYDEGNVPLVYAITRRGAKLLANDGLDAIGRLDWTTKNGRAHAEFIAHTIEVADIMVAFEIACQSNLAKLIDHHALLPYLPETTRADRDPFHLRVDVRLDGAGRVPVTVVPDRVFSLFLPDDTRLNFPLEHDRGTMPVNARQLVGRSSYRRKLLGYWHAWKENQHTERWGFKSFRPLTVTTSDERIESMIDAQREIVGSQGSNMFLFTTLDRLRTNSPLDPIWISGKGETVSLLPSSSI